MKENNNELEIIINNYEFLGNQETFIINYMLPKLALRKTNYFVAKNIYILKIYQFKFINN